MELPEIEKLTNQMRQMLMGKKIADITFMGYKFLNMDSEEFIGKARSLAVENVSYRGKLPVITLSDNKSIIISTGMGADVLYYESEKQIKPGKIHINMLFDDGSGFTIRFWWFGKFHLVTTSKLCDEKAVSSIGIEPFSESFTLEHFKNIIRGQKTPVKAFLLDQKNIGGIGNMYVHDILFKAKLHPQKKLSTINDDEIGILYNSVKDVLEFARDKGAFQYDLDFFGQHGEFTTENFFVGYKEGLPCPTCDSLIEKIKTGSNSGYICPDCQKL